MEFNYAVDTKNYREVLLDFAQQIDMGSKIGANIKIDVPVTKIAVIGMGGSGLPGDFLKSYLKDEPIPVFSIKDFSVPNYIDKNTLIFVISYSGNTEETIAAYRKVTRLGAPIVVITAGGKLEQLTPMYKSHFVKVPSGLQPRAAIGYLTMPIIGILQRSKIISDKSADIKNAVEILKKDTYEEFAKDMAIKIGEKTPIIYASSDLYFIPYKWKISFNENAKRMAFANAIPECNHNEICGYESTAGKYYTILIKDVTGDDPRIKKRIEVLKDILKKKGNDAVELVVRGDNLLSKILTAIYLGDWVAYYTAILHNTDPSPVPIIEDFKDKVK